MALSGVPNVMGAGVAQVTVGAALSTVRVTPPVAFVKSVVSVGVKVTESGWEPAESTVPTGGE